MRRTSSMLPRRRAVAGMTLVEIIVVLCIAGVLMGIGLPAFTSVQNSLRVQSTASLLQSDLAAARAEAIKRNQRVLMCVPTSGACGTSTNWGSGWWICYDADSDGACDTPPASGKNPNPIVQRTAPSSAITVTGPNAPIRFNANGTQGAVGAATATITITPPSGTAKTVSVAATGNITKQ